MRFPWIKDSKLKTKVGLFVAKQRIDLCALAVGNQSVAVLDSAPLKDISELPAIFSQLLTKHEIKACVCNVVLSNQFYQLLQIDKPQVPDEEIISTLPFIAKEYISEPIDSVVFDYFSVPNQNKINLVYSPKVVIEQIVAAVKFARLELLNIGVEELSTANLFKVDSDAVPKVTQMLISQQDYQEVMLTIIHDNQLYFSRRLRGFSRLRDLEQDQFESGLLDNFSLEIQRSADFVVSQLRIPEVKQINLALSSQVLEQLMTRVQINFTIPLVRISHDFITPDIDMSFLPAISGAVEDTQ